ncbi:SMP-30/gluconolactonase/LRE family protein [Bradyrhizobium ottawaense]|uniref:SMP-30/gluconolactonase/LRE family protein n=1 Tax=Bradyrhizobium ottawaense TaxID=931866 RepID=UPI0038329A29
MPELITPVVDLAWDIRCSTGESPVWDPARNSVWFCDIPEGRLHAIHVSDGSRASYDLRPPIGSLGLCRSGKLVVAIGMTVALFDPERRSIETLAELTGEPDGRRLNDGKVGPDGCFWVGSMVNGPERPPVGILYRVCPDGRWERKVEGYCVPNGIAWTPDGQTMFSSDSRAAWVDAWSFDSLTGRLSGRRRVASLSAEEGRPDGAACDIFGRYWSAGVSSGYLNVFSCTGRLLNKIEMPVPAPTMPCFASNYLYVTSLRSGLDAALITRFPALGGLFRMRAPVEGAQIELFADK